MKLRNPKTDWFPEIDPTNLRAEDFAQIIFEPSRLPVPEEVTPQFVLWRDRAKS